LAKQALKSINSFYNRLKSEDVLKALIFALITLISLPTFSDSKRLSNNSDEKKKQERHPQPLSVFDIIPLNSPVKESTAKFLLKVPNGFDIDEVKYKVKNAFHSFAKDKPHQKINLINGPQGTELHVSVSKLPPGFYQLYVKVKDRKNKEHEFKTKYKDHAMFVIDQTLEVKMPDSKINNATLLGVDSDNDGIRDDVQRWINENFSNKPIVLKLAFKQYAIAMQSSLPTSNNKTLSIQTSHATLKSQGCLYEVGDETGIPGREQEEIRKKIKLMYLNTKERIEAELKADENFHGQEVTILSKEEACNF
jgi:hypothetical protein